MSSNAPFSNSLIHEKSPYLLQHAHNPVNWYPWGQKALDKAKQEDKPVLLSIGYSTCHWCHVMAHESFEDEGIANIINKHFIAIKVDREERPDLDHIYMTATTAMTGQGGWPLTVFLTPTGDPFYGGTYFPPNAKWGSVGFIDLLNSIAKAWQSDRENILSSSLSVIENLRAQAGNRQVNENEAGLPLDDSLVGKAFRQLRGQFDSSNGGFGSAPKFPMGHNLSFLLRYHKHYPSSEALSMVEKTLTGMSQGGIWDHLGGGFHRYSTDQYWHVPHFEKMLYDQALLSRAYLEAYQATGHGPYANTARDILDYVLGEMTDEEGGFYSAQDADSLDVTDGHSQEGAFYVFSESEINEVLGAEKAQIFNYCYGVMPQGNAAYDPHGDFSGKNILFGAHSPKEASDKFNRQMSEIQDILMEGHSQLLERRAQRPRPHLDDKVLCDWNGLMIASFAFASRVLGEPQYAKAAGKAADFILKSMVKDSRLCHRWRTGEAGIQATLEDYAFFIYGLLDLYEATFQKDYLEGAERLADGMIAFFADPRGGFYMTASDAETLIIRPKEAYDGALPSGNSVAALSLMRLSTLIQKESYNLYAESLLRYFSPNIAHGPGAHCFLLSAQMWQLQGPLEITLEGGLEDSTIAKMLKILYKYYLPFKTLRLIPGSNHPRAHICFRGVCKAPIDTLAAFEQQLLSIG